MIITSGAAAGRTASLGRIASDGKGHIGLVFETVDDTIDITADPAVVESIRAGDELRIDNSRFLALQTYHRHQFPPANPDFDYPDVYDYYRNPDGSPKYPQRGVDIGAAGTLGATGQIPTGRFNGKMIVVEALHDGDAPAVAGRLVPRTEVPGPGRRRTRHRRELPALVRRQREPHRPDD